MDLKQLVLDSGWMDLWDIYINKDYLEQGVM